MTTSNKLIDEIKLQAESLQLEESSRRDSVIDRDAISILGDCQISRVELNHCVSKQDIANYCGIGGAIYSDIEQKAISEGKMQPAIKHSGRWQYTPQHIHAMLDYLGRPSWKTNHDTAIINFQNQKGGTGKSMAAISLATSLALDHNNRIRICIIDLDPQGSLRTFIDSYSAYEAAEEFDILTAVDLMLGESESDSHYQDLVERGHSHRDLVYGSLLDTHLPNLKVMPAFPSDERFSSAAWLSGLADGNKDSLKLLKEKVIDVIRDDFDIIILDTGPQINPLTWNALYATSFLLIPVTPRKLDWNSTIQFYESIPSQLENLPEGSEGVRMLKLLITNKDIENNRDDAIVDTIKSEMGTFVLNNHILKTSAFEAASRNYRTVCDIKKSDKLCPSLQLDRAQSSVSAVTSELKGLLKDAF
ncbi:ParA family protein [Vibrio parahaemolyticus]|nr:ParA family protein [Vibrio parahaemolyticus]